MTEGGPLLMLDTATHHAAVGVAEPDGRRLIAVETWSSAHRHGDELLVRLDNVLARAGLRPANLGAVVVGTGPGSFTGLRIGLATAKVLAYSLSVPIVGIATSLALGRALADRGHRGEVVLVLPAGARDRYLARLRLGDDGLEDVGPPQIAGLDAAATRPETTLVAVDLGPPEVPQPAAELGRIAIEGLPLALAREGAAALAAGTTADVAVLVPTYVALPRGIAEAAASMRWSPDLR